MTDSSDYYLSFLIKNALINNQWKKQIGVVDALCDQCPNPNKCTKYEEVSQCVYNHERVLYKREQEQNSRIVIVPRKGLKAGLVELPLAALPVDRMSEIPFEKSLTKGYGKLWRLYVCALAKEDIDEAYAQAYFKERINEESWERAKITLEGSL